MRSIKRFFTNASQPRLAIMDSVFPQKEPLGFRNTEINEYLNKIDNMTTFTMSPLQPGKEAWFSHSYGVEAAVFQENKKSYLKYYPKNKSKIRYFGEIDDYNIGLAYSFFLAETFTLLPIYEEKKIPFVFVLYPGGGFGLNNHASDAMLRKIFSSPQFREVIVTQKITHNYLISQKLCSTEKIAYIYGGFVQFQKDQVLPKKLYSKDKKTLDLCFVAAKYSEKGIDKGYDAFVEMAHRLYRQFDNIRFHVIGGFDETDEDVSAIREKFIFYGYLKPDDLQKIYPTMDVFVASNKPFKLYEGNFDGFPLGIDAAYCGVALFVADELKMNVHYTDGEDIVILPKDIDAQVSLLQSYLSRPDKLYALAQKCQQKTQELFDINLQIEQRCNVFAKHMTIKSGDGA